MNRNLYARQVCGTSVCTASELLNFTKPHPTPTIAIIVANYSSQ